MPEHSRPDQDSDAVERHEVEEFGSRTGTRKESKNPDRGHLFGRFQKTGTTWTNVLGESWAAHDTETGRDVVITHLPADLTNSEWILNQLEGEVEILHHLRDDSIVGVLEFIRDEQGAFLVEEAFEGEDLATFLARDEGVTEDEAEVLALGILHTLEVAHATGIAHRDLRPEHVFIDANGFIKVRGFSVARMLRDQQTTLKREIKDKARVLAYTPPEDLLNLGTDERGDLYAYGCLVYQLYTGQPPFTEGNVAYSHVHHEPVPLVELCPSITAAMNEAVLCCLAKKPDDRFATAGDVRIALAGDPIPAESTRRTGFRPLIPLAAAAILVIAAAGVVYFLKAKKKGTTAPGAGRESSREAGVDIPGRTGGTDLTGHDTKRTGVRSGTERPERPGGLGAAESGSGPAAGATPATANAPQTPHSAAPDGKDGQDRAVADPAVAATPADSSEPEPGPTAPPPEPPVVKHESEKDKVGRGFSPPDSPEPVAAPTVEPETPLDAASQNYLARIAEAREFGQQGRFDEAVAAYLSAQEVLPDRGEAAVGLSRIYAAWGDALLQEDRLVEAQQAYRHGLRYGEDSRNGLLEARDKIHARMKQGLEVIQEPSGLRVARSDITLTASIDGHPLKQMTVNDMKTEAADDGTCRLHLEGLADGHHAFKIQAMDPGGNVAVREITVDVDTRAPSIRAFSPKPGEELPASRVVIRGEVDEDVADVKTEPEASDLVIKDRTFVATVPVSGLFPEVRFQVVDRVGHTSEEQQVKLYNPTWTPPGLEPRGDKFYSLKDQSYMVRVPGVQFIVRDARGRPRQCKVHPFFADVTEVTNAQYRRFLAWVRTAPDPRRYSHPSEPANKDHTPSCWDGAERIPDDLPVVGVDWWDAYAYARWAGKSLFHDATWVVAARGVPESLYPWGDAAPRRTYANYQGDPAGGPLPVLKYEQGRSPFGCYEMAGNVMEWCLDSNPEQDRRLAQGGSWFHSPRFLRVGQGVYFPPDLRTRFLGFRCARYLTDEPDQPNEAGN